MIATTSKPPRFSPGQIIQHRRYRYRGVIVDVDRRCSAGEAWYQSNATQPDRNQPWYHVLVDQSRTTTYVAEENLQTDPSGAPVEHPLVDDFFDDYADGRYVRNGQPWPGSA